MSFFVSLLSVCALLYFGSIFGSNVLDRFFPKMTRTSDGRTIAFWCVLLFGGFLLCGMSPDFFPIRIILGWLLSGAVILWGGQQKFKFVVKILLQLLLCLASVLVFGYVSFSFPEFYLFPLLAVSWWLCWQIFVYFDRFPITSSIISICWTMALLSIGFLQGFPVILVSQAALLGVVTVAFARMNLKQKMPILGNDMANLTGFIWGGIWCAFLSDGLVMQTICMFGYYLFEALFLGIALIKKKPLKTFFNQLIEQPALSSKAVSSVFYHCLILFVFGAMMMFVKGRTTSLVLLFVLAIVLMHLYMRLKNLVSPPPKFKDILGDIKQGVVVLAQQVQQKKTKDALPKKKTISSSKVSVKKKNVVKKASVGNKKVFPVKKVNKKKGVKKVKR